MLRSNLPRAVRHLRRHRRWRQADLASASGLSREAISRLERGLLRGVSVATVEKVVVALDAAVDITVRWEGATLDRLIDAAHARLQEAAARELARLGWEVRAEVSFNQYGDRGRIDIAALHRPSRALAIVEVKSAIGDLQDTLGRLDVKVRLGRSVARDIGWTSVDVVVPVLAVAERRSVRRVVAAHPTLFARFDLRGRQARAWLRRPRVVPPPMGLVWFVNVPDSRQATVTRPPRVRPTISGG